MNKQQVKEAMKGALIAVVRGGDIKEAKCICEKIVSSGITALEITFTLPGAEVLIKELKEELPNALIGAGTVLTRKQAELAINNGADFIVSPCVVKEVGHYCKEKDVFCSMGAATPTEAYESYMEGSDVVKLFPGDCISPKMIKDIQAPMPFVEIMPTGGVDDANVKKWFECGAFAVGLGGYLTKGINSNNLDELEKRCKKLIAALKEE